ncbi:hypothetical protein NKJ46_15015 [Mesorhizobium sp. M0166]|uniref:hypothetical protein n=1 Tax=unclassified Mesorhizobium TaxID=325217 RepID=UPI003339ED74
MNKGFDAPIMRAPTIGGRSRIVAANNEGPDIPPRRIPDSGLGDHATGFHNQDKAALAFVNFFRTR